ncbi:transposase IS116/IS110/IS902 family protein [Clostridium puniceum]|uniref:Transposase IS116/IS110/IS902 family protein n=1 Tax=Clostridium puniceum TaxID=29367 RepID=A0A1S8TWP8_9CLOT|nr:IS110 family transposase [Clostridium puniceum]OOM82183.1 transposase IS116/IS110/IS902 family protein [Clostridium puniceum]
MISVGIDISKGKSTVCIMKPYGEVIRTPYEIKHTEKDLSDLADIILDFDEESRVTLEATGAYHLPVLSYLKQKGIFVAVINPLMMKKYSSLTLRKGKTDKIDSIKISNYGIDNWFHLNDYCVSDVLYDELNTLCRQYNQYVAIKIKCKINLANLLDKTMPGITNLLRNNDYIGKYKLNSFVKEYWHYDNITKKSEKQFIQSYLKWAKREGYHANEAKAKSIYTLAKESITTLSAQMKSTKMLVIEATRVFKEVEKTIRMILLQMQELAKKLDEYNVVRAMPGVGDVLAPRLIGSIGDIRRFHNGKALIAYAGIDAPPFESGNFKGTRQKISKRGSSYLRKTGYEIMTSLNAIKPIEDSVVYDYMLKKESEGKAEKVAKIAGLNKFLRIYYARVKEVYSKV